MTYYAHKGTLIPPEILATALEQSATGNSPLTKTGHTPAAGTTHVVVVPVWGRSDTRTISSVTYDGNAMDFLDGVNDNNAGTDSCGVAFYIIETSSPGDIVLTMSDGCDSLAMMVLDLKGVGASPNHDSDTDATTGSASKSIALATTRPTLMLGARAVFIVDSAYTPGSGVTEEFDFSLDNGAPATYFLGSRVSEAGENFNFGCTIGSTSDADAMAAVALAGL